VLANGEVLAEGTSKEILQREDVRTVYFGGDPVARDQ